MELANGMVIEVPKGTSIRSTHPRRGGQPFEARRTYRVTLHSASIDEVMWSGEAGYWCRARRSDVRPVQNSDQ